MIALSPGHSCPAITTQTPASCGRRTHPLRCTEVWGGQSDADEQLSAGGLLASLYSRSCEGTRGGDVYYLSVCEHDYLARVAIADVVGHGRSVAEMSRWLYEMLAARLNDHDDAAILSDLNRVAFERGLDAITTAVIASCCRDTNTVALAFAGHWPALVGHGGAWQAVSSPDRSIRSNLPLGVAADTRYDIVQARLTRGDRLLLYTDGLIEARDESGTLLGTHGLIEALATLSAAPLADLKAGILAAVARHIGGAPLADDVTFLAVEVV